MVTLTLQSKANKDINHFNFFSSREPKPMIECNLEDWPHHQQQPQPQQQGFAH